MIIYELVVSLEILRKLFFQRWRRKSHESLLNNWLSGDELIQVWESLKFAEILNIFSFSFISEKIFMQDQENDESRKICFQFQSDYVPTIASHVVNMNEQKNSQQRDKILIITLLSSLFFLLIKIFSESSRCLAWDETISC